MATINYNVSQPLGAYTGSNSLKVEFQGDPFNNPYAGTFTQNNFQIPHIS